MQLKQIDTMLNAGIDILVLDPVNRFSAAEMVRKAHRKGIKVISYDRLISNCEVDAFLSFDSRLTGRQMAEAVTRLKPEGTYVILGGDKSDLNAIGIDAGQQEILTPFISNGKIKVDYKIFIEKYSYDDVVAEVKKYLDLSSKIPDAILTSSDVLAKGTVDALKSRNLAGEILVTGQGGELSACISIVEGTQLMISLQTG
ncbi:MAG: substrate-binding domain-containing protein [Bacteroidetes bacterium]|nr:substrate-binding domain-containing protein [Bacteroidota bacterium]